MNISRYISELLFDYECVVLPGLGGFITNEHSATINRLTHEFKPPYFKLFFNVHLKADDGLLVNYLSQKEDVSYSEARKHLEDFVGDVKAKLENGEKVLLESVGSLFLESGGSISFEQDYKVNYNSASFGLKSFISPAVKREEEKEKFIGLIIPESKEKRKPVDRKLSKADADKSPVRKKTFVKPSLVIALLALMVVTLSWGLQNSSEMVNYLENQASFFPFDNTTPIYQPRHMQVSELKLDEPTSKDKAEEIVSEIEEPPVEEQSQPIEMPKAENPEVIEDTEPVKTEAEVVAPEEEKIIPKPAPTRKTYYVIAGSFSIEKNAIKYVNDLKLKGYNALIADTNANGMYRVAFASATSFRLAKDKMNAIRQEESPDAWILKK